MTEAALQNLVHHLFRKESRSLIQYIGESFPFTTKNSQGLLPVLRQIQEEEKDNAARLLKWMRKRRIRPPYQGSYPMSYTTLNYQSLDHLLPYLVDHQQKFIHELERELGEVADPELAGLIEELLESKRKHLRLLKVDSLPVPSDNSHHH